MIRRAAIYLIPFLSTISISPALADGQSVPINYDNLSFFEEPLATDLGVATLNANILIDQSAEYHSEEDRDIYNSQVIGSFRLETELPNTVQIGAEYIANYNRLADNDQNDEYTDDFYAFLSDEWGIIAIGNVTQSVREKTRRDRGFGNADLSNDDFIGGLDETGAFYSVRYNAYEVSIAADQEGRVEAGINFEQPIGKSVYNASARIRKGDTGESPDIADHGDALGTAIVGQYTYASFLIGAQLAYEQIDIDDLSDNNDHVFASIGSLYKYGSYRFSLEGSVGRYDGDDRRSLAFGSRIDIARGLSVNTGVNYRYNDNDDATEAILSMRYEF